MPETFVCEFCKRTIAIEKEDLTRYLDAADEDLTLDAANEDRDRYLEDREYVVTLHENARVIELAHTPCYRDAIANGATVTQIMEGLSGPAWFVDQVGQDTSDEEFAEQIVKKVYELIPDSLKQSDIPRGVAERLRAWARDEGDPQTGAHSPARRARSAAALRLAADRIVKWKFRPDHTPDDTPDDKTTAERAAHAEAALMVYHLSLGAPGSPPEALCDLLCDLLHYADRERLDFDEALRMGRWHHDEEK